MVYCTRSDPRPIPDPVAPSYGDLRLLDSGLVLMYLGPERRVSICSDTEGRKAAHEEDAGVHFKMALDAVVELKDTNAKLHTLNSKRP